MRKTTRVFASVATLALALPLAACGGTGGTDQSGTSTDSTSGDGSKTSIEVWSWEPTLTEVAKAFEEANPDIKVNITNVGTAGEEYTALNNAIAAGSGAPDLAQIEYYAVPQFSMAEALADLTEFGAGEYADFFNPGPWSAVTSGEQVWALPVDSGPVAYFYNAEVYEEAGVTEVPKTWDEFRVAGEKIHALGPDRFIAADSGSPDLVEQYIWARGGHPFGVDGADLTISLDTDQPTQEFIAYYQELLDNELIETTDGMWSDEWWRSLEDGNIASILTGAWMAAMLRDGLPTGEGKWRVSTLPQVDPAKPGNGENGGSSLAIMESSSKKEAAYKFAEFASHDRKGIDIRMDLGQFPADRETLADDKFLNKEESYFGGQKINEVLAVSAETVLDGWQYLPYDAYARTIFGDTAGQAFLGETTLRDGINAWQEQLVTYGHQQGFTVNGE